MFKNLIAVAGLATVLSSSVVNACESYEEVTSAWLPIMQTTAYYVAIEEGLFEKACIKLDSNKMQSPNHIIDALVGGRADFGSWRCRDRYASRGKISGTFKVFGLQGGGINIDLINDGLIVKSGSPIKSFSDLEGYTIGHVPGIQWRTITRHLIRSAGLDPDKQVKLVDLAVPQQVPAVLGGQCRRDVVTRTRWIYCSSYRWCGSCNKPLLLVLSLIRFTRVQRY